MDIFRHYRKQNEDGGDRNFRNKDFYSEGRKKILTIRQLPEEKTGVCENSAFSLVSKRPPHTGGALSSIHRVAGWAR